MASLEYAQVIALGCGVHPDGSMTTGTMERGLVAAEFVTDNDARVISVDFSGKYSCYAATPSSGYEAEHMDQVATAFGMPRDGIDVFLDIEADDTSYNFTNGLRREYLVADSRIITRVATHRSHWPRAQFIGNLAMPGVQLRPLFASGQESRATEIKERLLRIGYGHVMRHVKPGDLEAIEDASALVRRAAMSVVNRQAQPDFITTADRIGYMWDLIRGEG